MSLIRMIIRRNSFFKPTSEKPASATHDFAKSSEDRQKHQALRFKVWQFEDVKQQWREASIEKKLLLTKHGAIDAPAFVEAKKNIEQLEIQYRKLERELAELRNHKPEIDAEFKFPSPSFRGLSAAK